MTHYEKSISVMADLAAEIVNDQQAMSMGLLNRLVMETPVDTGRAKGNWQVSEGTGKTDVLEVEDKTGGDTIAKGAVEIGNVKAPGKLSIRNNLPYIERLNEGYSKRAPAGFVEAAIDAVVNA